MFNQIPKQNRFINVDGKIRYIIEVNEEIKPGMLNDEIYGISIYCNYTYPIGKGVLPDNLKELLIENYMSNMSNETIVLPNNLEQLIFRGDYYGGELSLPNSLKYLELYNNHSTLKKGFLPPNLELLVFGRNFNQVIEKDVLPESLKVLYINSCYNQIINKGVLPSNLIDLRFFSEHIQKIEIDVLPKSLQTIYMFDGYDNIFDPGVLPESLTSLNIYKKYNQKLVPNILPKNLRELYLGDKYNQPIDKDVLPDSLEVLQFGFEYNKKIKRGVLPRNLKHLSFDDCFNKQLKQGILPDGLIRIVFGENYDKSLLYDGKKILPRSIQSVYFNNSQYDIDLIQFYPDTKVYYNYKKSPLVYLTRYLANNLPQPITEELIPEIVCSEILFYPS